jgi:hypothetical protein
MNMGQQVWHEDTVVLLIGNVDHEGVRSVLFQTGRQYKKKVLHSKPENWQSIIDLIDSRSVSTVLVKLTDYAYELLAHPDYSSIGKALLTRIATLPHVIYVFEGLYTGEVDDQSENENEWARLFTKPKEEVRILVNGLLDDHRLNVSTYNRNSEVTVLAQAFLSQCETGLLLRLYVPNAQLWARETDKILQLFRDYLTRVARVNVRLDETRTPSGVIYELHDDPNRTVDISTEFEEFSHFVNLCASDMTQAELILHDREIAQAEVIQILTRYAKESRRLQIDMRQEREQKVLSIRHRLESELIDVLPSTCTIESLGLLVDAAVPAILGPRMPLLIPGSPTANQTMTVNINPQFVNTVNGIVAQEISGDVSLTESDRELFRLFAKYAKYQQAELVSALRELNDESAPKPGRLTAKQKIGKFLLAVGSKTTDVAVGILQSYIEKKMLGL